MALRYGGRNSEPPGRGRHRKGVLGGIAGYSRREKLLGKLGKKFIMTGVKSDAEYRG